MSRKEYMTTQKGNLKKFKGMNISKQCKSQEKKKNKEFVIYDEVQEKNGANTEK